MDEIAASEGTPTTAPRTETEKVLLEIWREILELGSLGIYDDFLESGGHSLSATLCIARIKDAFGVEVPLSSFFLDPAHVAGLAAEIDAIRSNS